MAHTSPDELPPARYASAGGVSIAYQVMGAGPDVVLVSGMLNNIAASWQKATGTHVSGQNRGRGTITGCKIAGGHSQKLLRKARGIGSGSL